MNPITSVLAALLLLPLHVLQAAAPDLSRSDLDGVIATVADAALKEALDDSAAATQLEMLALEDIDIPDNRLPTLRAFSHLESLTLVRYGTGYPAETQSAIKKVLPNVDVRFVK